MEPEKCGKTKADGKPCGSYKLRGKSTCLAHADAETRESVGFGGYQEGSGRPRVPRPTDVARGLIERNVLAVQRPYWRTLGYDVQLGPDGPVLTELPQGAAKLYGESKDGDIVVSHADDLAAQMMAADKLQDRVYGKPKTTTEISGALVTGGPELVENQELAAKARELLNAVGAES